LPQEIAALRTSELETDVNQLLFQIEAAARKTSAEKLLETEAAKRIAAPTVAQIEAVYAANRASFEGKSEAEAKKVVTNYLRGEAEEKAVADFATTLRTKYKITRGVDVNSPALKPADVLVTVGGKTVTAANFNERLKPLEFNLRQKAYYFELDALEDTAFSALILLEAEATNTPPEDVIRREITEKTVGMTREEQTKVVVALGEKLKAKYPVKILLAAPQPPVLKISADDDPSRGNAAAPVTVVMFTDFQCPVCAAVHPIVNEVLKNYPATKVRFVVRDFPLTSIHENAFRAAEAAGAANAQGKFFEYIDVLYQNQKALDDASLKKHAAGIGLNTVKFNADFTSGKFAAEIRKDLQDGKFYGINGTPTIYVNGIVVSDLTAEALKSQIERALAKK
jgi:protein-disulfide isomerase